MKARKLFSAPDPFVLAPLLSLLPDEGKVSKLQLFTSSLYARFEKVKATQKELSDIPEQRKSLLTEENMLKEVLDFLAVKPAE